MTTIHVVFRPDGGGWLAQASADVEAWGRNLRQAADAVRAAAAHTLGQDPRDIDVRPAYDLPAGVAHRLEEVHEWREEARRRVADARRFESDAVAAAALVADDLVNRQGLTLGDAGALLGVSLQRVHQLLQVRRGLDDERLAALRRRLDGPAAHRRSA